MAGQGGEQKSSARKLTAAASRHGKGQPVAVDVQITDGDGEIFGPSEQNWFTKGNGQLIVRLGPTSPLFPHAGVLAVG